MCSSICPIVTGSKRFCALKICDSGAVSYLVMCPYRPGFVDSSLYLDFMNIIGELQGFIDSQQFDVLLFDFNVDYNKHDTLASLSIEFTTDFSFVATDLSYCTSYL